MANDQAWQAGMDIAQGKKDKKTWKPTGEGDAPKKKGGGFGKKLLHVLSPISNIGSKHKGGSVKKTGNYRLKKGEKVLTGPQQKRAGLKKGGKKKHAKKRIAGKA